MNLSIDNVYPGMVINIDIAGINSSVPFTIIAIDRDCMFGKRGHRQHTITIASNDTITIVPWFIESPTNWNNSYARSWLNNELYMRLPIDIRNRIQPKLNKRYDYDGNICVTDDTIWIPSMDEFGLSVSDEQETGHRDSEGSPYEWLIEHPDFLFKKLINTNIQTDMWTSSLLDDEAHYKVCVVSRNDGIDRLVGLPAFLVLKI